MNKRRFTRSEFRVAVSHETQHNFWTGFTENISAGGLFIATVADHEMGDVINIAFTPPGFLEPIQVTAKVCWRRRTNPVDDDAPPGYGVEFLDLPAHAAAEINRFIGERAPLFYDDLMG